MTLKQAMANLAGTNIRILASTRHKGCYLLYNGNDYVGIFDSLQYAYETAERLMKENA